jgi:hypothetical protein
MELVSYVARRMLEDVCGIAVISNPAHEPLYEVLYGWTELCTERFQTELFPNLPCIKQTPGDLSNDMLLLYAGILRNFGNPHSRRTLNGLFTITFYMMIQYKEHPDMCSLISYDFELLTRRLRGWANL